VCVFCWCASLLSVETADAQSVEFACSLLQVWLSQVLLTLLCHSREMHVHVAYSLHVTP
jgi:hypothetical protein